MIALILALALGGCAYWVTDMQGYRVQRIEVEQRADLNAKCGQPAEWRGEGCAIRLKNAPGGPTTLVYIRPGLTDEQWACVLAHEAKHAGGMNHDGREIYRRDC